MSEPYLNIVAELERIAAYTGPWLRLQRELPLLKTRVAELRERETRGGDVLIVALVGGSGVGKSTLLNALAGDELAKTSPMRPCTSVPTVYHPPGFSLRFETWRHVSGSALEHLALIDTPDSDTIVREHRAEVVRVLAQCDLILLCGSKEKYLDEATWSLLRPLQQERALVCVETKCTLEDESIREHWLQRLGEHQFQALAYFRVNALRTFDRKLTGRDRGAEELDFVRLETFLRDELTRDRIDRIKRSNAAGLVMKTVGRLHDRLQEAGPQLDTLAANVEKANRALAAQSLEIVERRLFAEPYLWTYALGRETSLRAKGIVGTLYRVIEAVRGLPARMAGWLPGLRAPSLGRRAAGVLSSRELIQDDLDIAADEVALHYRAHLGEVTLGLARAEFEVPQGESGLREFRETLNHRVTEVLRGPARDSLVRHARGLTCWPVTLLLDLPPVAFFGYAAYIILNTYFHATILDMSFLAHSLSVIGIVLLAELLLLSVAARWCAWRARRQAVRSLRAAFLGQPLAFQREDVLLRETCGLLAQVAALREGLAD